MLSVHPFQKTLRAAVLLAGLLASAGTTANADGTSSDKTFRFNVSPNGYPPYLIVGKEGPAGIMWDVVNLIIPRLGYTVEAVKIPRKRIDQMLQEGYVDGTPRAIEWTREPENYVFTDSVVYVEEVFFFPKTSKLQFAHPADLYGKTVVTHLGYLYPRLEPYFKDERIKRFDVSRDRELFTFVLHGDQFHAALADRLLGHWILKNEGLTSEFRSSVDGISKFGFRIMLREDWADFASAFNRELANVRENGELDAILERYR